MVRQLPTNVEPFRLAEKGITLHGTVPLLSMQRLCDLLLDAQGEATIEVRFGIDEEHISYVGGEIGAQLLCLWRRRFKQDTYAWVAVIQADYQIVLRAAIACQGRLQGLLGSQPVKTLLGRECPPGLRLSVRQGLPE